MPEACIAKQCSHLHEANAEIFYNADIRERFLIESNELDIMSKFMSFIGEVKENIKNTYNTNTLRFDKPEGFDFKPGQFVTMQFIDEDGNPEKTARSFTMSSSPDDNFIDITVKREGVMSGRMCGASPGEKLKFSGPFGNFVFISNPEKHHVFLAGGSGVTPFRCFMRFANQNKLADKMTLFYSNKTEKDIIFKDEFEKLASENENISNIFTLTRDAENAEWKENIGRIEKELLQKNLENIHNTIFYICGSKDFVNRMLDIMKEMQIKPENIKTERWN